MNNSYSYTNTTFIKYTVCSTIITKCSIIFQQFHRSLYTVRVNRNDPSPLPTPTILNVCHRLHTSYIVWMYTVFVAFGSLVQRINCLCSPGRNFIQVRLPQRTHHYRSAFGIFYFPF